MKSDFPYLLAARSRFAIGQLPERLRSVADVVGVDWPFPFIFGSLKTLLLSL